MSERPIEVGDIVQVVKPTLCCGNSAAVGWTFQVREIRAGIPGWCKWCDVFMEDKTGAYGHPKSPFNVLRLKRIPPLDEPAEVYETKPLKEPVT